MIYKTRFHSLNCYSEVFILFLFDLNFILLAYFDQEILFSVYSFPTLGWSGVNDFNLGPSSGFKCLTNMFRVSAEYFGQKKAFLLKLV